MRNCFYILLSVLLIVTGACQKQSYEMTDAEIIAAIQKATDKHIIDVDQLPYQSISVLDTEYANEIVESAKIAPELGYEVDLISENLLKEQQRNQAYFNIDGRELKTDNDKSDKGGKDGGDKFACFTLIYPVTYILPDESEVIINDKNDNDGWAQIKDWYNLHPDVAEKPVLSYPVDIKWKDGTIKTISSAEEMQRAKNLCDGNDGDKKICFVIIYPVSYTMPDGSVIRVISDDENGWANIKNWYRLHPDVKKRPELNYPVDIKWRNGEIYTISTKREMKHAKQRCENQGGDNKICFELVYPVGYKMPDNSVIRVISNDEEGWQPVKRWYRNHPDVNERPSLIYPVDIIYRDGTTRQINSKDEMINAKKDCEDSGE